MKNLVKKIAFICAVFCFTFFTACHDDDVLMQNQNPVQSGTTRRINLQELEHNRAAYNNVAKYLKQNGAASRSVYDPENDFWIDVDNIIQTDLDGYRYYTLHIYRDVPNEYTEYLYLHPQSDDTYLSFLVQHKLSGQELLAMKEGRAPDDLA